LKEIAVDQKHFLTEPAAPTIAYQQGKQRLPRTERGNLYETLAVILMALWLVALVTAYAWFGGWVHILLFGALVMLMIRFTQVRRSP